MNPQKKVSHTLKDIYL